MSLGIFWVFMAAAMLGIYALPSKFVKGFSTEQLWGSFWFLAMFVVPIIASFSLVNGLESIYSHLSTPIILSILGLSMIWGVGNLLWGISISKIGMALGFSLLIGISTLVGSLLPFFMGNMEQLFTPGGLVILAGLAIIIIGIICNGKAGLAREDANSAVSGKAMKSGILMCVVGGVCAAGFNLAYYVADHYGQIGSIAETQYGNETYIARLAVMLPAFIGSGIVTVGYYLRLLSKKEKTRISDRALVRKNIGFITIMAVVYCISLIIYGLGAYYLGKMGTSVGFALFQTGCIMVANLSGILTGEWASSSSQAKQWMYSGLAVMTIGIVVVSFGNYMLA